MSQLTTGFVIQPRLAFQNKRDQVLYNFFVSEANFVQNFNQMQEQGKGLYLYSETKGSGKTRLMASVVNALTAVYDKLGEPLSILILSHN